jgi:hypothetical protein
MEPNYIDELVEKFFGAMINAKMWQTIAMDHTENIPGPILDNVRKRHQQALEPLWNEYKKQRLLGNDPQAVLRIVLPKLRGF